MESSLCFISHTKCKDKKLNWHLVLNSQILQGIWQHPSILENIVLLWICSASRFPLSLCLSVCLPVRHAAELIWELVAKNFSSSVRLQLIWTEEKIQIMKQNTPEPQQQQQQDGLSCSVQALRDSTASPLQRWWEIKQLFFFLFYHKANQALEPKLCEWHWSLCACVCACLISVHPSTHPSIYSKLLSSAAVKKSPKTLSQER